MNIINKFLFFMSCFLFIWAGVLIVFIPLYFWYIGTPLNEILNLQWSSTLLAVLMIFLGIGVRWLSYE